MGVARGIVFPTVRIVLWAVIALALAWLAFVRSDPTPTSDPVSAGAVVTPPVVPVTRGDVLNVVALDGTVSADPAAAVKATEAGEVTVVFVPVGAAVAIGTPLLEVRYEVGTTTPEPVSPDPAAPPPGPAEPIYQYVQIRSTAAGTLSDVPVLEKQVIAVGDVVAKVSPGTLAVRATLTQGQQLRLLAPPTAALVEVVGGPAPFSCGNLTVGVPADAETSTQAPDPYGVPVDPSSTPTGAVATCTVPAAVTVAPGLSATMELTAGQATGVLTVPITAVQGSVATGNVWVVPADGGEPVPTPVTLGLTDGTVVEVTKGLTDGEEVLEFVPDTDPPDAEIYGPGG